MGKSAGPQNFYLHTYPLSASVVVFSKRLLFSYIHYRALGVGGGPGGGGGLKKSIREILKIAVFGSAQSWRGFILWLV